MFDFLILFWPLWILVIVTAIIKFNLPAIKGFLGEKMVSLVLNRLPKDEYIVLNDIILPTDRGTTQIDHVVASVFGIFVIETKNYKGWIYGGEKDDRWTHNMYGKKHSFMNPIHQNYKHTLAVKNLLKDYDNIPVIPIVAFSRNCELKNKDEYEDRVVYIGEICDVIRKHTEKVLTEEQINNIVEILNNMNKETAEFRGEHVSYIKERLHDEAEKAAAGICPRCGGTLVEKNGRYGKFIACDSYPKCRFTVK
jgi:hypothetical protein